jgi:hypothetical protein
MNRRHELRDSGFSKREHGVAVLSVYIIQAPFLHSFVIRLGTMRKLLKCRGSDLVQNLNAKSIEV